MYQKQEQRPQKKQRVVKEEGNPDRYSWKKVIGKGTFGTVYKAIDLKRNMKVAIKKVYQDPNYRNREFKIVVELDHTNCIMVHNYFFTTEHSKASSPTYLNLVMDYVADTLYRVLRYYRKNQIEFPAPLAKIYSYQMFRALAYIHGKNIVHRDIKPQNILVDTDDHRLVICDFGSAKVIKSGEKSVSYICSRFYRAPELIFGGEHRSRYGPAIDVWSIGCVIAEMFLGEPLFSGINSKDQLKKIMGLLGTPTRDDMNAIDSNLDLKLPHFPKQNLGDRLSKTVDPLAVDLLEKILVYNPEKRLMPLRAMLHPYFDELREQRLTINGQRIVDMFDMGEVELSAEPYLEEEIVPKWYRKKKFAKRRRFN
jgi:glycogen synthase kinase 3 beta